MGTVYLVRHGETPLNDKTDRLFPGEQARATSGIPLNDEGKQQALAAGQLLRGRGIVGIACSELTRTIQTAQIIQSVIGGTVPLSIDTNLDTWRLGLFSGMQITDELDAQIEWYEQHPDERVPGGESFNQFLDRIDVAIKGYEAAAEKGPLALVTHGRILFSLEHVRSARTAPISDDGPPPGSVIAIKTGKPGYAVVKIRSLDAIIEDARG